MGSTPSHSRRHQTPQSADHIKTGTSALHSAGVSTCIRQAVSSASSCVQASETPHHPLKASGVLVPLQTPSDRPSVPHGGSSSSNVCTFKSQICTSGIVYRYVPVNAGEPVKVLILAPAACRPFKHLCGKLIFSFSQIRCQLELRRCKGILTVADIAAIQPQSQPALCSLEGYKKPFSLSGARHLKIFDIAGYRVETGRNLTRLYLFS